jgi:hypothetical protein
MVQAMQRVGVDMGYRKPQNIDHALYGATPDLSIAIGEGVDKKSVPGIKTLQWSLPEPVSPDDAAMDRLRLAIDAHVDKLMQAFN